MDIQDDQQFSCDTRLECEAELDLRLSEVGQSLLDNVKKLRDAVMGSKIEDKCAPVNRFVEKEENQSILSSENVQKVLSAVQETTNNVMSKSVSENAEMLKSNLIDNAKNLKNFVEEAAESAKINAKEIKENILNKSITENAEVLKTSVLENVESLKNSVKESEAYKRIHEITEKDVRKVTGELTLKAQDFKNQISTEGLLQGPDRNSPSLDKSAVSVLYLIRDLIWLFVLSFPIIFKALVAMFKTRPEKSLKDKVVVVTGAASGLGKELAVQLGNEGCKVACVDLTYDSNKETALSIVYSTGRKNDVKSYACDVSKPEETKKLCEDILKDFGKVDILVNNAGVMYGHSILSGDDSALQKVIDVNLLGNFWMVRSFLPSMMENESGHIVFINSGSAFTPVANASSYSASKCGLLGLTYALEDELRRKPECNNIKLTSVHPYFVATNEKYVPHWRLRIPPMPVTEAVTQIITGIKREYFVFSIPLLETGYWISCLSKLLPRELYRVWKNVFYVDILVNEQGVTPTLKEKTS